MQKPRLVATDVDGTLLDPFDRVTPRVAAVIARLVADGVGFVLVTGRPPRWIPPVVAQLDVARMAVCANGAVLYDAVEDTVLWSRVLAPATLADLAAATSEALPGCGLAVERLPAGAYDPATTFVAEPDYLHAWPDADNGFAPRSDAARRARGQAPHPLPRAVQRRDGRRARAGRAATSRTSRSPIPAGWSRRRRPA